MQLFPTGPRDPKLLIRLLKPDAAKLFAATLAWGSQHGRCSCECEPQEHGPAILRVVRMALDCFGAAFPRAPLRDLRGVAGDGGKA